MRRNRLVSERTFQSALLLALSREPGVRVWRQNAGKIQSKTGTWIQVAPTGAADITGIVAPRGRRLEIEVKRADGRVSEQQSRWHAMIAAHGGIVLVARYDESRSLQRNIELVLEALREARRAD